MFNAVKRNLLPARKLEVDQCGGAGVGIECPQLRLYFQRDS